MDSSGLFIYSLIAEVVIKINFPLLKWQFPVPLGDSAGKMASPLDLWEITEAVRALGSAFEVPRD